MMNVSIYMTSDLRMCLGGKICFSAHAVIFLQVIEHIVSSVPDVFHYAEVFIMLIVFLGVRHRCLFCILILQKVTLLVAR